MALAVKVLTSDRNSALNPERFRFPAATTAILVKEINLWEFPKSTHQTRHGE